MPFLQLSAWAENRYISGINKESLPKGDTADAVFYVQTCKVKLTVVSKIGKEATIGILSVGDFFGEGSLAGQVLRMCSATAMTDCAVMRIDRKAMVELLHREHELSDLFVAYLLSRNIRYEEDLVDQLFNSSEKPSTRLEVERMPSFAPSTAARSQPIRPVRCASLLPVGIFKSLSGFNGNLGCP